MTVQVFVGSSPFRSVQGAAALNALGGMQNAMATLASLQNAEDIITGKEKATDSDLQALEAALKIGGPESSSDVPAANNLATVAAQAVADERNCASCIRALGTKHNLEADEIDGMINNGTSITDANAKVLDILASRSASNQPALSVRYTGGSGQNLGAAMVTALLHRTNPQVNALTDDSKQFAHMSMIELVKAHLGFNGVNVSGLPAS